MKHKLMIKYPFISTLLVAAALCLLGLPFGEVKADPPDPTPTPAMDIRTKLQPYQTPGAEPSQFDGRTFEEAPLPPVVEEPPIGALAQQTLYCTADAMVLQGYPSQNFGDTADMLAGYDEYLEPDGQIARSLIQCNVSSLPPNQVITKATLRVYLVSSWDFPNTSRRIRSYRITGSWSESSVTWNNRPGYGESYGSQSILHGDWDWYGFDVTDLVSAWYDGTYTNYGIMLRGPEVSGYDASWRGFGTRESSYRPRLVVEFVPPPTPPSGEWFSAPSPTVEDLESVYMLSATNGWAVGRDGTILHYDGNSWATVASPTAWDLEAVYGVSASDIWAVGEEGTILHYNGSVWSAVTSPTTRDLYSVHMISGSDGWAVGYWGTILHYNGSTWSEVASPVNNSLESLSMVSTSDGWAVGSSGTILHYNGSAWTEATSPTDETLRAIHMLSAADGWAVGNSGAILHYNGSSWTEATSPTSYGLKSVYMTSTNDGWAIGVFGKLFHYDGSTWMEITDPSTSSYLNAVYMVSADEGWIVGEDGLIFHYTDPPPSILTPTLRRAIPNGGTNDGSVHISSLMGGNFQTGATVKLTRSGQDISGTGVSVYNSTRLQCDFDLTGATPGLWDVAVTNPDSQSVMLSNGFIVANPPLENWEAVPSPVIDKDLKAVYMTSANDGWAVGESGTILNYDGSAWSAVTSPTDKWLYSVHCPGPGDCWAAGASGTIVHYDGSTWTQASSPTWRTLYSIYMLSASNGWAVGSYGTILHYDGSSWTEVVSPSSWTLFSIQMLSASNGWAVGSVGTILHYDGSGWSQVASPTSNGLNAIAMVSANNGWAMGAGGRLLHYNGSAWTKLVGPLTDWYWLYMAHMASANDGWAMGYYGNILHYDGNGWVPVTSPTSKFLYAVHGLTTGEAWAVGQDGTILHYHPAVTPFSNKVYLPIVVKD